MCPVMSKRENYLYEHRELAPWASQVWLAGEWGKGGGGEFQIIFHSQVNIYRNIKYV
jgi:hypothetical protein